MNKIERVTAAIEGRQPDRPPFSCWHHFRPDQIRGTAAVEAHVRHLESYDLDFLKIMDDNRYPRTVTASGVVQEVDDLDKFTVFAGDEDSFGRQLELIGELAKRYSGELPMATTVFNSWGVLRGMTVPETGLHGPPSLEKKVDPRDVTMTRFLREAPEALQRALEIISESLANFARHCVEAGADGIFLSVRDDWVDNPTNGSGHYGRLVQPTDLEILGGAARGTFNLLHVCGTAVDFARFGQYPVHAVNWADRYAGPTIQEALPLVHPAICGGLDNLGTMADGLPDECAREAADALSQMGDRPLLLAPGYTYDPDAVPAENIQAICRALRGE